MRAPNRLLIGVLCWLTVVFEGFDIVALGASVPTMLKDGHLSLTKADANYITTLTYIGVALGAAIIGYVSDRFGRRRPLLICLTLFSIFTLIFPLMTSVQGLSAVRFIAGLGLGGCMIVAITTMQETLGSGRKAFAATLTMSGYHLGAVGASAGAIALVSDWHALFYIGGGAGLAITILMFFTLPETLAARTADSPPRVPVKLLLSATYARTTIGLWVAAFMGLMLVYGLNSWLPLIMREAGYPVAEALTFLLIMNVGAVIGLFVGGLVADKFGVRRTTLGWFAAAATLLVILSVGISNAFALNTVIVLTGFFVFCAQVLVYGFVGYAYPSSIVATGLGFVSGVGRFGSIIGPMIAGALVASGNANPGGFYLFAGAAICAVVAIALVPKPAAQTVNA